jgi:hypothetical protein
VSTVPAIIRWDQAYNRNGDRTLPRAVVNAIRTHMNNHTLEGWVKAQTLADYTGLSLRVVRKQIADNVAAGWLVITDSGNSSGKANDYKLTYPKGVVDDTIPPSDNGVVDSTLDSRRVSYSAEKGVAHSTPTTYRTSPQEKFPIKTSPREKGAVHSTIQVVVPDPFGSGDFSPHPMYSTSESNGAVHSTLAKGDTDPAERLCAVLADGPIPAKSAQQVMGLPSGADADDTMRRLIDSGQVIYDRDAGQLILA